MYEIWKDLFKNITVTLCGFGMWPEHTSKISVSFRMAVNCVLWWFVMTMNCVVVKKYVATTWTHAALSLALHRNVITISLRVIKTMLYRCQTTLYILLICTDVNPTVTCLWQVLCRTAAFTGLESDMKSWN